MPPVTIEFPAALCDLRDKDQVAWNLGFANGYARTGCPASLIPLAMVLNEPGTSSVV
jgi:hypothetical protein